MADINIKNCNNIDEGVIKITEGCLNIKHAINGTGKTTIAKAIKFYFADKKNGTNTLVELKPFKSTSTEIIQSINGLDIFNSVEIFNEDYVNNITFIQNGELLKGSFEIFIKDDDYNKRMEDIDSLLKGIIEKFKDDENLNNLIEELISFGKKSKQKNDGTMHASCEFKKALDSGNLVDNIPEELNGYSEYIKNNNRVEWLAWLLKGKNYINSNDKCPCCVSLVTINQKEVFHKLTTTYDKNNIEYLNEIIKNFESLKEYFDKDTWNNMYNILHKGTKLTDTEQSYILGIKGESDILLSNLEKIRNINFYTLKQASNIKTEIDSLLIKYELHNHFKSDIFIEKINPINDKLNKVLEQISQLQGKINNHKSKIQQTINAYRDDINSFLLSGGYNYEIDNIEGENSYSLILKHIDKEGSVKNAKNTLSFGERNALALILFMFDVLSKKTDLIILDDPISSFDKNKKFAIINRLFGQSYEKSLRGKTVVMLTHDFEPIIDIVKNNLPKTLQKSEYTANFLINKNNILSEKKIEEKDILSCLEIAEVNIQKSTNIINKLIYLRRLVEIKTGKASNTYNLLSSLLHKREFSQKKVFDEEKRAVTYIKMSNEEIDEGEKTIGSYIDDFNYEACYKDLLDTPKMIQYYENSLSNYEKLQIYRIINEDNHSDSIIRKFINESFHIENDYLFQLNPCVFETIPQYIIDRCNDDIKSNFII